MTLVVADTSPICYLIIIEAIDALPRIYDRVIIPQAVLAELTHAKAPVQVRNWSCDLPKWVEVKAASKLEYEKILDRGEAEAISLAIELKATAVLIDEIQGRKVALDNGLPVAGTIGFLELAARHKLIDLQSAFAKLARTNFRMDPELVRDALERAKTNQ